MRLSLFVYLLILVCGGTGVSNAYGQLADTVEVSQAGKIAKSDELYFSAIQAKMHDDDKQAMDLLEQFILERTDVSAAYYDLSVLNYKGKKIEKAEAYIKKAIELDNTNKWYKEQYASILADRGAFEEAAKLMAELAKEQPDDPSYLIAASEYFEHAKKYDQAISYIDKAIQQTGIDEELLQRKMQIYLSLNNVDKAADVVKQLIDQDPKNGKYYKLLADLYDNNKMPAKAAAVYENAQRTIPGDPSVQLGIAEHYLKIGDSVAYMAYIKKLIVNNDLDADMQLEFLKSYVQSLPNDSIAKVQGLPIIKQLVAQHPEDAEVVAFYGEFLDVNNQHDSAMVAFKRSLALKPGNFNVWEKILSGYSDRKDADSLVKYSEKAMRLFPNQAIVHFYNAIGHQNRKEYAAAIKAMNRAIDLQPENEKEMLAQMYSQLADIYHSDKKEELSDQAFEKALKLSPNDATILNNYSYYLSVRGVKLDEAEQMSKKSLEIKPGEATFLDTYGWILYEKKEYEKAREYVQKAIDMSGPKADATLYDHLGNIYYKLNNKDKAVENWKISKEKGNDDPQIDKKISEGKFYE
jgi:tetratricopeptide (TPR) repeat protein